MQFEYTETEQTHKIIILDRRTKNYNTVYVNTINMRKDKHWEPTSIKYIAS